MNRVVFSVLYVRNIVAQNVSAVRRVIIAVTLYVQRMSGGAITVTN